MSGELKKEACLCIMTLKNTQKIVVFQNVPDLDLSNCVPKALIVLIDSSQNVRNSTN